MRGDPGDSKATVVYTKDPFLSIKKNHLGVVTDLEATKKKNTEGNEEGNENEGKKKGKI